MSESSWLTVIVPGIAAPLAHAAQMQSSRWPQLERFAGRGSVRLAWDRRDAQADLRPWQRGLLAALKLPAEQFASAPVSAVASRDAVASGFWFHAEPVHFVAGLDRLSFLALHGAASVTDAERSALVSLLAEHLRSSGFALHSNASEWLVQSERALAVQTACPEAAASNELESVMPRGPDAGALRRLMTELQMLLHEHPVNEARARRGLLAINAVWPWGAGIAASARAVETLPAAFGEDSYLRGIYKLHGQPVLPLPEICEALLAALGQVRRAIVVTPVADIDSLEQRWVAPALRALAARQLERVDLILDDVHVDLNRAALRRFWRRPLPLAQWPLGEPAASEQAS